MDNPAWRRPRGRPENSWLPQVNASCWEFLSMGRKPQWRLSRRDRLEWRHRSTESAVRHPSISGHDRLSQRHSCSQLRLPTATGCVWSSRPRPLVRMALWFELPTGLHRGDNFIIVGSRMEYDQCVGEVMWLWMLYTATRESKDRFNSRGFKSPNDDVIISVSCQEAVEVSGNVFHQACPVGGD
ncbi:hypothetical protein E2C01_049724 [Portunus trituberculatus]|uniref:Uncharacterized protein n=1 Tax=Portunus trituberculatus TaxID=210409 RepID=A0A5B7G6C9_PORTR|nr:hypothetical protein [Portunus trituberculatus]